MNKSYVYDRYWGDISLNGVIIGVGYSGASGFFNRPDKSNLPRLGPIPQGKYTIVGPFNIDADKSKWTEPEHLGRYIFKLVPDPRNKMFGRSDFYIHGDNLQQNHSASEGCIASPHITRSLFIDQDILYAV